MVHGITEYQMREMNNGNIPYRSIAVLLFTVLLSSCLKETAVPIESVFTIEASEDKTSPITIQLKNESYGADEYEWTFEDAQGKGLTPASDKIAEDMKFGTSFDLSTIKDDKVRENLERLSKKSDDELFKNLINLAEWVSSGDLEDNNKRIIAEWHRQVYQTSEDHYTDSRLTDAVFKEETTQSLISEVKRLLHKALRVVNGDISRLSISNYIGQFNIKRPVFSSFSDKRHGLTFALNDTWGFKVTLLNYRYDATTKKYWAKLKFDVFDHFGLDKDDVVKFGSMEKVQDRAGKLAPDSICQQAADGFCSWFILQYKRGYKPFVTMMSKEIEMEGRL